MMFAQIKIKLLLPEGADFSVNKSSLMHGVLSGLIPAGYAEKMHEQSLHPYTQYIRQEKDGFYWVISTLDDECEKYILEPVNNAEEIYIEHNDLLIGLGERIVSGISADDLFLSYGMNDGSRKTTLVFLTPTAFKSSGQYVNMPSVPLIFQSLIRKYDSFSGNTILSDEFVQEIAGRVLISSYDLRSTVFPLEGITIPSFTGRITFYVKGGGALPGMIRMLCEFARYSGVGIKTSMGMGAVDVKMR